MAEYEITSSPLSQFETFGEAAPQKPKAMEALPAPPVNEEAIFLQSLASISSTAASFATEIYKSQKRKAKKKSASEQGEVLKELENNPDTTVAGLVDKGVITDNIYSRQAAAITLGQRYASRLEYTQTTMADAINQGQLGTDDNGDPLTLNSSEKSFAQWWQGRTASLDIPESLQDDAFFLTAFEEQSTVYRDRSQRMYTDQLTVRNNNLTAANISNGIVQSGYAIGAITGTLNDPDFRNALGNQGVRKVVFGSLMQGALQGDPRAADALTSVTYGQNQSLLQGEELATYNKRLPDIKKALTLRARKDYSDHIVNSMGAVIKEMDAETAEYQFNDLSYIPQTLAGFLSSPDFFEKFQDKLGSMAKITRDTEDNKLTVSFKMEDGSSVSETIPLEDIYKSLRAQATQRHILARTQELSGQTPDPELTARAEVMAVYEGTGYKDPILQSRLDDYFDGIGNYGRMNPEQQAIAEPALRSALLSAMHLAASDPDGSTLSDLVGKENADYVSSLAVLALGAGSGEGFEAVFQASLSTPPQLVRLGSSPTVKELSNENESSPYFGITHNGKSLSDLPDNLLERISRLAGANMSMRNTPANEAVKLAMKDVMDSSITVGGRLMKADELDDTIRGGRDRHKLISIEGNAYNGITILNTFIDHLNKEGRGIPDFAESIVDSLEGVGDPEIEFQIKPMMNGKQFHILIKEGGVTDSLQILPLNEQTAVWTVEDMGKWMTDNGVSIENKSSLTAEIFKKRSAHEMTDAFNETIAPVVKGTGDLGRDAGKGLNRLLNNIFNLDGTRE